ncbi:unnamed protein product [Paramecium primaurelia]|uniref:Uncharacterized protein n=2 Tax=Paramecium TaxID=5884 RepID=A0A8S1VV42_9CILI|nr:unnamed protein product [Paramecium primaurelia]CAD8181738.1 unnamed protein product [Paramecium pentaurelia]
MNLLIQVLLMFVLKAELDYPYSCDCQEHDNQDSCEQHKCLWDENQIGTKKCRVKGCSERGNKVAECVAPSQFYSTNRTSCYPQGIQTETCEPISSCEELDVSKISPSYARRVCKVNFCGYNKTSKGCRSVSTCSDITTEDECNNLFINELPSLFQPIAYCYWVGDVCMTSTRFFGACENRNIKNKNLCKTHGCQWKDNNCVNLNCSTITTDLCSKEHIDSFGNVHICSLKNSQCNSTLSADIRKEDCDKMTAHTFDEAAQICKPCKSLAKYLEKLASQQIITESYNIILMLHIIMIAII